MSGNIEFHGVNIQLDQVVDGTVTSRYETVEIQQALGLFAAGDRVIVAGAGVGWLAAIIAAMVGAENVICVEPIAHLARLVSQDVAVDGVPVRCLYGALTPDGAPAELCYNRENWALSNTQGGGHIRVPGRRLADFFEAGFKCLALDVEGAESELLSTEMAGEIHKGLIEIHTSRIGEDQAAGIRHRLQDAGLHRLKAELRVDSLGRADIESWTR